MRGIEPYYVKNARSSLDHSHVLLLEQRNLEGAKAVLHRLLQKVFMRIRSYEKLTCHISVKIKFRDPKTKSTSYFYNVSDISATDNTLKLTVALETLFKELPRACQKLEPIAVGVNLTSLSQAQDAAYDLFTEKHNANEVKLNKALDILSLKYGKNTIYFAGAHAAFKDAPIRIAFNHIPEMVVEED